MPSTVEQLSPTRVKITVEVPFADLKPSMDKAYREIAKTITIPGFRKGKVPPMVIDQRFGRGVVIQEALNEAIPTFYEAAVTSNSITPMAQPEVEVTKLEDGDSIEFTAEVDVRPEFELPDFSSVAVTVDALESQDHLVDDQLSLLRTRFGTTTTVERPAADGDVLAIDLEATVDGEPLDDATAQDLTYVIGSEEMLDGLDEAVIGLSAGESNTFSSELVGGPLKGTAADITVSVKKVQERELPEADDEFAQLASEFDTLDELKTDISSRLTDMARLEQAGKARDAVLEDVIDKVDIDVPAGVLSGEISTRREQVEGQLQQAGMTLAQYLEDAEDDQTEEEFWSDLEQRAEQALRAQLILDKVADSNSIGVDQNDLTQHIIRRAQAENTQPQQIAEHLQEHPHHIQEYMTEIRRGKALAILVEASTITDSNGDPVSLTNLQPDGSIADPAEVPAADDAAETSTVDPAEPATADADDPVAEERLDEEPAQA